MAEPSHRFECRLRAAARTQTDGRIMRRSWEWRMEATSFSEHAPAARGPPQWTRMFATSRLVEKLHGASGGEGNFP